MGKPGDLPVPVLTAEVIKHDEDNYHLSLIKSIEDELLLEVSTIVRDAMCFRDIEPNAEFAPAEWYQSMVDKIGDGPAKDEAAKRFRMAKAAWMNSKEAPVGLKLAQNTMIGIIKARATEDQAPRPLNVAVQIVQAPAQLPSKTVDN